jgi:protein AbiQ
VTVVVDINNHNYFAPITSYKISKPDNFLILAENNKVVGSIRFNYMFPVPSQLLIVRNISDETDTAYKRVILGKNLGLVHNNCDFKFLELKCIKYIVLALINFL